MLFFSQKASHPAASPFFMIDDFLCWFPFLVLWIRFGDCVVTLNGSPWSPSDRFQMFFVVRRWHINYPLSLYSCAMTKLIAWISEVCFYTLAQVNSNCSQTRWIDESIDLIVIYVDLFTWTWIYGDLRGFTLIYIDLAWFLVDLGAGQLFKACVCKLWCIL